MPIALRAAARRVGVVASLALLFASSAAQRGAGQEASPVARCVERGGVLLAQPLQGGHWKPLAPKETVGDVRLLALFDAVLRSGNGAVEMKLMGGVGQRGPLPILESVVEVRHEAGVDLAVTLERGLVVLTNAKPTGSAKIRLHVRQATVELTLKEPKARIAFEVYGRHAPGAPHLDDPSQDRPVLYVFGIALEGEAYLQGARQGMRLQAPPGPAVLTWDSLEKVLDVRTLETLPENARPLTEAEKKQLQRIDATARHLLGKGVGPTLAAGLQADQPLERKVAVTCLGALDELPSLLDALATSPHQDVREQTILVLRHWLGRGPGQIAKLYGALTAAKRYTPPQAKTILHLLLGLDHEQRRQADTYDLLIDALLHRQAAIRTLAHWHLVRLVPNGNTIAYDALAPAADRQRAFEQWRTLVPPGQLPRPSTAPHPK